MKVTLEQVFMLNKKIGATVYAQSDLGELVAASVSKSYIRKCMIDDLINTNSLLTKRAIDIAKEILEKGN